MRLEIRRSNCSKRNLENCTCLTKRSRRNTSAFSAATRRSKERTRRCRVRRHSSYNRKKLASVGQLAAGVAHEINNPIGFIMSNLGTLKTYAELMGRLIAGYRKFADGFRADQADPTALAELATLEEEEDIEFVLEDIEELMTDSIQGTVRVKDIVQGLKSFSRVDEAKVSDEDLHAGLEATLKVVANEIKYKCEVVKEFDDIPLVPCNLAQINQVFMNLLVNAAQAIEEQGDRHHFDVGGRSVRLRQDKGYRQRYPGRQDRGHL